MAEKDQSRLKEDYPKNQSKGEIVTIPGITEPPKEEKLIFPTEIVDLPSKGLMYPEESILRSGKIEIKYMTAKEEDILTNQNFIKKGTVIDKLLESLIVTQINYTELTIGDKNALMIAARILGYGESYPVEIICPNCSEKIECDVNLTELKDKDVDYEMLKNGNHFNFELPYSKIKVTFKQLTVKDERKIEEELKFQKKVKKNSSIELSTRLKYIITSVDGETDDKIVRDFVDKKLLARDSLALRKELTKLMPDIDMSYMFSCDECEYEDLVQIPMTINFFWPNAGV